MSTSPVFTLGHSTRTVASFVALLRELAVDLVVDVRSFPRSQTNPQFNADVLPESLAEAGMMYQHLAALGGRRHRLPSATPSRNLFWKNAGLRNYADYATGPEFRAGFDRLRALTRSHRCAIMCAEAVWWRCHRRIIADYLLADGFAVMHILGPGKVMAAQLTSGARPLPDGTVLYPADPTRLVGDGLS